MRRGGFVAALAIADERWLKEEYAHQGFQFIWGDTAPGISNVELQNDLGEYALMKVREQGNGGEGAKPLVKALTPGKPGGKRYQPWGRCDFYDEQASHHHDGDRRSGRT